MGVSGVRCCEFTTASSGRYCDIICCQSLIISFFASSIGWAAHHCQGMHAVRIKQNLTFFVVWLLNSFGDFDLTSSGCSAQPLFRQAQGLAFALGEGVMVVQPAISYAFAIRE